MERDDLTGEPIEVGTLTQLPIESPSVIDRTMIDIQVATAKNYPRSIDKSVKEAESLALRDEATAESMFYVLPRGNKDIIGPSVQLAEIIAHTWTNIMTSAQCVEVGEKTLTAEGICWDMERNHGTRIRVERRITDKRGKKYNDDMILVTSNAAVSIAFRNAVLKTVPRVYVDQIFRKAMVVAAGDAESIAAKRSGAVSYFAERGVKPEQVYEVLGVNGLEDIGVEQLIRLRGMANAVKGGETTIEAIFSAPKDTEATSELDGALTPDYLAVPISEGTYDGKTLRDLLADAKGRAWIRRYVLPKAIGDRKTQIEAALANVLPEAPDDDPPPDDDPLIDEAYAKAAEKSARLVAGGGEFSMDESMRMDEMKSAGDFNGLIALDEELAKRLLALGEGL